MEIVNTSKLRMVAESFYLPKSGAFIGDDAHFISKEAQVIGVADGVGSWRRKGIDPGKYSRELMRHAADFVAAATEVDPKTVLKEAFEKTAAKGSSTACIIRLDGNLLRAVNVGDSGFMVVRKGKTLFKSNIQQRRFNDPYQLGRSDSADTPEVAEEMVVPVESGDVVVAGTDGLFDNLYCFDVVTLVQRYLWLGWSPATMAEGLGREARAKCGQFTYSSPFQDAAEMVGRYFRRAKNDDTTVVVACISESPAKLVNSSPTP